MNKVFIPVAQPDTLALSLRVMRAIFLSTLGVGLALTTTAQQTSFPIDAGLAVQGGTSYWTAKWASFERFQTSYNAFYASRLRTPLGDLKPTSTYSYGGGAYIGPLYFTIVQHRTEATASAVFANGDRREMTLDFHPLDANFDLMFPAGKRLGIGMALGLELQKARLYSGYRYTGQDVLSYADDNPLNGVYDFFSTSAINIGLRTDIKVIKRKGKSFIDLSLRAEYVRFWQNLTADSASSNLLPHRDEMTVAATGGYGYSDGYLHKYLPVEATNRNNEYVYFIGTGGEALNNLYRGWRFSASLIIIPVEWRLN